jgi:hypothetical protein
MSSGAGAPARCRNGKILSDIRPRCRTGLRAAAKNLDPSMD